MNEFSWQIDAEVSTVAAAEHLLLMPKTKGQLVATLTGLVQNGSMSEWGIAALVYAWCKPGTAGGDMKSAAFKNHRLENEVMIGGSMSFAKCAALGIKGLKVETKVSEYYSVYAYAVKSGIAKATASDSTTSVLLPAESFAEVKAQMIADPSSTYIDKPSTKSVLIKGAPTFSVSLDRLDKLTVADVPSALLLVKQLSAWIESQKMQGNVDVATAAQSGPTDRQIGVCGSCGGRNSHKPGCKDIGTAKAKPKYEI